MATAVELIGGGPDDLEGRPAEQVLAWAAARYSPGIVFATGFGAEGCVLIDLIARHRLPIGIFTLDTGLLFPETYDALAAAGEALRPAHPRGAARAERRASRPRTAASSLWEREPDRCCEIRKVDPLRACADGQAGLDHRHPPRPDGRPRERAGRRARPRFGLVKVNPLLAWTRDDVWAYLRKHDVPYNPLHAQGYPSIGCWPCTTRRPAGRRPARRTLARTGQDRVRPARATGVRVDELRRPGTTRPPISLVPPHGGRLVDRFVPPEEADALQARAEGLPSHHARCARARRPRADRDRRGQPARRLPGPRRLRRACSSTCGWPTARCGRCPSRSRWTTSLRARLQPGGARRSATTRPAACGA